MKLGGHACFQFLAVCAHQHPATAGRRAVDSLTTQSFLANRVNGKDDAQVGRDATRAPAGPQRHIHVRPNYKHASGTGRAHSW